MEREDRDRVRVCVVVVDVLEWINQIGATAIGCRTQSGPFLSRFRMLSLDGHQLLIGWIGELRIGGDSSVAVSLGLVSNVLMSKCFEF